MQAVVDALAAAAGDLEVAADRLLSSGPPTEVSEAAAAVSGLTSDDDEGEGTSEVSQGGQIHGEGEGKGGAMGGREKSSVSTRGALFPQNQIL